MNYYQISKQLKVFTMISDQLWQTTTTANSPKGCELHKATCSDLSQLRARDRTKPRKQHYSTAAHCYNSRRLKFNPSFSCHRRETQIVPKKKRTKRWPTLFWPTSFESDGRKWIALNIFIYRYRYYIYTAEYICSGKLAHHANWMGLIFLKQKHKTTGRFWRGYPTNSVEMFVTSGLKSFRERLRKYCVLYINRKLLSSGQLIEMNSKNGMEKQQE